MDTVFAVDHILELIFNNLSGRDLLNCQLVSCEWFTVARKVLSRRRSSYFYLSDSNILQINAKTVKGDAKIEGEVFWFQWLMKNFPSTQFLKITSDSIEGDHVENCISSSDPVFIRKVIADRTMCAPKFALIFGPLSPACVPSGVPTLIIGTNKAIYSAEQSKKVRENASSLVNVSGFLLSDSCTNLKIELISNWFDPSLDVSKTISSLKFPKYVLIRLDQADGITHNPKLQSFLAHLSDVNCKVSLVCSPFCIHRTSSMSDKSFVYGTQPVVIFSGPKMVTVQKSFTDLDADFLMEVKMFKSSLNFDPDLNDQSSQTLGFVFGTSLSEFCMERIRQIFPRVVFIGAVYNMNRTIIANYFDDQPSSYFQPVSLKSFSERVKTTLMRGSPPKDGFTITLMNIASNAR